MLNSTESLTISNKDFEPLPHDIDQPVAQKKNNKCNRGRLHKNKGNVRFVQKVTFERLMDFK